MPFCSKCGYLNPENAKFCQQCGTSLRAPVAVESTVTQPTAEPIRMVNRAERTRRVLSGIIIFMGFIILLVAAATYTPPICDAFGCYGYGNIFAIYELGLAAVAILFGLFFYFMPESWMEALRDYGHVHTATEPYTFHMTPTRYDSTPESFLKSCPRCGAKNALAAEKCSSCSSPI